MADDALNAREMFQEETELLAAAEQRLESQDGVAPQDYGELTQNFAKLLNKAVKITKLGDRVQKKQRRLMQQLAEQKQQIEAQSDALAELNEKLRDASLTDPLTRLRNRRFIVNFMASEEASLVRAYANATPEANRDTIFFLLDIDHFKKVNDNHGHAAGDVVLVQFAEILNRIKRESDIAVRWGGEEFLLVARNTNRDHAPELAEKIRFEVEEHVFNTGDGDLRCTCSLGYAPFPFHEEGSRWEDAVELADRGLYAAKKSSRNAWVGFSHIDVDHLDDIREPEHMTAQITSGGVSVVSSIELNAIDWR